MKAIRTIKLALAGMVGALCYVAVAQAQLFDGEQTFLTRNTSGDFGDASYTVTLRNQAIRSIAIIENNDVPCAIDIDNGAIDRYTFTNDRQERRNWWADDARHEECGSNGHIGRDVRDNEAWFVSLSNSHDTINWMRICQRRSNNRIKGLQIRGTSNLSHDELSTEDDAWEQPNCNDNWATALACPAESALVGLRVYYNTRARNRPSPIVGLRGICAPLYG